MNEQLVYERLIARLGRLQRESGTPFKIEQEPGERVVRISSERASVTAPIVIEVERDDLVSLTIGEAAHFELYGKSSDVDLTVEEVTDWVKAVLRGGLTETIFWRDDEVAKSELHIVVEGSDQKIRYHSGVSSLLPFRKPRRESRSYQAYS